MTDHDAPENKPRRLIRHDHRKRPLRAWIIPLIVILAIIIFLPKIVGLLEK